MRLKIDIQRFDEDRVMFFTSKGLTEEYINAINDLAQKEEWTDILFATLDDKRIALVCKPATGAKVLKWDIEKNKNKYPDDIIKDFLKKSNEALYSDNLQLYVEKLTKDEEELKKMLADEAYKIEQERDDSQDDKKDETWEGTK